MSTLDVATLWANIQLGQRRDFLVTADSRISFIQLEYAVRRWLAWFDACAIGPTDRVVIRTLNEVAAISAFVAAILDGVIPVMLTPDTPDVRAAAVLGFTEASAFVDDATFAQPATLVAFHTLNLVPAVSGGRRNWLQRSSVTDELPGLPAAATRPPRLPRDRDSLAYILFTSGTTSSPSGVQITHGNLFANLQTLIRVFVYDEQSRIYNDMILAHADGMIQGPIVALAAGCAVVRAGGFQLPSIEAWLARVRRERITHVIAVPTVWAMIDRYAKHDDYFDAPECRALLSVAAKLPEELWRRMEKRFGRSVFNQYGLTETVVTALWAGPQAEMGARGTIGRPIDCEAKILSLGRNGEGELLLRGANIFPGYWRDADRTRSSFTKDGWFHTGDLARLRPDGSYDMLGRLKTVIMMGGFQIRPDEIDEAMLRHPDVRESATIGIDDPTFGEVPVTAVVVTRDATEADLTAHARTNLESQKVPKRIIALNEIPRGDAGKPKIEALRTAVIAATQTDVTVSKRLADLESDVIEVAAEVFRVPAASLAPSSSGNTLPGWDSFSQLNFLLAIEERFDVRVPAAKVAAVSSISDMIRVLQALGK